MGEHRKREIRMHGGQPLDDTITPEELLMQTERTYSKKGTETPRLRRARRGAQQILAQETDGDYPDHEEEQKITPPFAPHLPFRKRS